MQLKLDCIRCVLLQIEQLPYGEVYMLDEFCDLIPCYTKEDIDYTCLKLAEGGYIQSHSEQCADETEIHTQFIIGLTFQGHEFLEKIKSDTVWHKIKTHLNIVGSHSLDIVSNIAVNFISNILTIN